MGLIRQDFVETFRIKQNFWKNRIFCPSALSIRVLRFIEFFETYGKTRFYPIQLIFVGHFKSFLETLFYFQRKVSIISCRMRTAGALCDKNSLLWFLASFRWKTYFSEISWILKIHENYEKWVFHRNLARNHRNEFLSHKAPAVLIRQEIIHTLC